MYTIKSDSILLGKSTIIDFICYNPFQGIQGKMHFGRDRIQPASDTLFLQSWQINKICKEASYKNLHESLS